MRLNLTFWKLGLLVSTLVMLFSYSFADTIVSVTDDLSSEGRARLFVGGQFNNVVAASWTQGGRFSNVTIDAQLVSYDASFVKGTAYLMSAIGPGTTSANEIVAPVNFTVLLGHAGHSLLPTVLFSGLTLTPGTYYLVLAAPSSSEPSPLGWQIPAKPVTATAPTVSLGGIFESNNTISPPAFFPPASTFVFFANQPMFQVTGTAVAPEPSNLFLIGTGLLGIGAAVRKKFLR